MLGTGGNARGRIFRLLRPANFVSHEEGLRLQEACIKDCHTLGIDSLILLQHEPHYTAGRRETPIPTIHSPHPLPIYAVKRGGQVTFHGPGQLTMYPILNLERSIDEKYVGSRLRWYAECLVRVMKMAAAKCNVNNCVVDNERMGLYNSNGEKVGFVGFHITRWVTSYGLSLNVCTDLSQFNAIVPCGDRLSGVANLDDGCLLNLETVSSALIESFCHVFNCSVTDV